MGVVKLSTAGIVNYEKYSNLRAGIPLPPPASFDLLETQVLASSAASVSFTSLSTYAADYQHLQLRIVARSARSSTSSDMYLKFNGDAGANYSQHYMRGDGSAMESANLQISGTNGIRMYQTLTAATNTANSFAATVVDIINPFESTKNTTARFLSGFTGSLNRVLLESGAWLSTDAVTSITLTEYLGSNIVTGSRFSLYGYGKGA